MSIKKVIKQLLVENLPLPSRYRTGFKEVMPLPVRLQIEPTTRCNLACIACPNKTLPETRRVEGMTLHFFRKIIDQVPDLCEIKLQGLGEPLISVDFKRMLEFAKERGIQMDTITNGMVYPERILQCLPFLDRLGFSVDGVTEETIQVMRSGARIARIRKTIQEVIEEKRKTKSPCEIRINSVVTHLNQDEVPGLFEMSVELGVDMLNLVLVENWNFPGEEGYEESRAFAEEAQRIVDMEVFRRVYEEQGYAFKLGIQDAALRKGCCYWAFTSIFITCDGYVTPCCIRPDPRSFCFGNLHEQSLGEIWNGEKMREFRRSHLKNLPNPVCDDCPG